MNRPITITVGQISVFLIIIIVICAIYYFINIGQGVSRFSHPLPKERYQDVVNEFGKPDIIVNQKDGVALWYNRDYFSKIMLKDESIEHKNPKPHCDFLYSTINVYIPKEHVWTILDLSESVTYDRLKSELTARCHFMGANIATLNLAMKMVNDPTNASSYKEKYGETIMSTMNPDIYKMLYNELGSMVASNMQQNGDKMANRNCLIRV